MKILMIRETPIQSLIADAFSLGGILASAYINYKWIGNSGVVMFVLIVMCLMTVHRFTSKKVFKFQSKEEAINFLQNE